MSKEIKIGLMAYGMSGKVFHAPLITDTQGLLLTHVLQRSSKTVSEKYPWVQVVSNIEDLLASDIDVLVINTPQALHYSQALLAIEAGKHVVIEKPATLTYQEISHLQTEADARGLSVVVFQNRRWDADYLTVSQVVKSGILGTVKNYDATFNRWKNKLEVDSWKEEPAEGSGTLYNLGSHLIDQAVHLLGKPKAVLALLKAERPGTEVVDAFQVTLIYPEGLSATLRSSYLVREAVPKFAIHGTLGSLVKYGQDVQEQQLKDGWLPSSLTRWGLEVESDWATLHTEKDGESIRVAIPSLRGDYGAFYLGLYRHLAHGAQPPVDAFAPAMTIKIIEAAIESNANGKVVEV